MATWDEFVSSFVDSPTIQKVGDDVYAVTLNLADGQDCSAIVNKGNTDGTWASITVVVGNVPDEKLNELLEAAIEYACGALVKLDTVGCCVRCSVSVEHLNVNAFVAVLEQTVITAAILRSRFCAG
jgi:hypothetical protein